MSKNLRKSKRKSNRPDLSYYNAVSSLPILVIVGIAIGYVIGDSLGGGSIRALLIILGAILGLSIAIYEIIRIEGKDRKSGTKISSASIRKFTKKVERISDEKSSENEP